MRQGYFARKPPLCINHERYGLQANVRQEIKETVLGRGLDPTHLQGEEKEAVAGLIEEKLNAFLRAHGITGAAVTGVNLPENRTFEISFGLSVN